MTATVTPSTKISEKAFVAAINAKYGEGTIRSLADLPQPGRLPTGIFSLDCGLGGGWPTGRISLVWGARSAGKSSLMAQTIKESQSICRHDGRLLGDPAGVNRSYLPMEPTWVGPDKKVYRDMNVDGEVWELGGDPAKTVQAFEVITDEEGELVYSLKKDWSAEKFQEPVRTLVANVEGVIDAEWVEQIGVDPNLVWVLTIDTAEKTIDIIDSAIRDGLVDLVVVDSIAAMTPAAEFENSMEKWQQGLQARLINKALRIWVSALISRGDCGFLPTILLVNQVRYKVGVIYGSPEVKPGGVGQDFATSVEVKLTRGSKEKTDHADPTDGGHLLYARTNYRVEKNKTFPERSYGQFITSLVPHDGYEAGQIMEMRDVVEAARRYGILSQIKRKWVLGTGKDAIEFKTLKAITDWARKPMTLPEFKKFRRALTNKVVEMRRGRPLL